MKKSTVIIASIITALLALTAALAIAHSATRTEVPEGSLLVSCGGKDSYVALKDIPLTRVQGTVVNGKGEVSKIDTKGAAVADVLKQAGLDPRNAQTLKVTAADEYSAELSGAEINETGKAYLIGADAGMKLVVFGDDNAKRNVRDVVKFEIIEK